MIHSEQLSAFALTEREAGSDAANVQMTATPTEDGSAYILNGEKRYITNAAIAHELTVMARTPVAGSDKTAVTAFLVTPDMYGALQDVITQYWNARSMSVDDFVENYASAMEAAS